jgi:tRNA dimethylallyltransferase
MLWSEISQPLVMIVGPTAVGKTELAIQLAERLGGEIVSADSRLFYRGMDIGTAKPTLAERERVPHHLIDVVLPDEPWSLAIFQKEASRIIAEIHGRNKLPFLVGGTGQYIQAVMEEWEIPAQVPDLRLRDILDAWGREIGAVELHHKLSLIDPEAAGRIEPRNLRRTVRALEVMMHTGKKFSAQRKKGVSPYRLCQVGLIRPREELYRRIDERIEGMIADGLLGEVEKLLQQGYSPDLPAFSAIGYREMVQVIQGRINLDEAVMLMKRYTRQFVRRQSNWFKENDPDIHWFELNRPRVDEIENLLKQGDSYR